MSSSLGFGKRGKGNSMLQSSKGWRLAGIRIEPATLMVVAQARLEPTALGGSGGLSQTRTYDTKGGGGGGVAALILSGR